MTNRASGEVTTGVHTPGPWVRSPESITDDEWAIGRGNSEWIVLGNPTEDVPVALVTGDMYSDHNERLNANARLIAAAPDLLAACQEFVRKVEAGEARSVRSYKQMCTAITKATGRGDAQTTSTESSAVTTGERR